MAYITHFTSYTAERGEFKQETTTEETLTGYTACGLFFEKKLKLFAIGGTLEEGFCSNWDIFADETGALYSIARPGTTCGNSYFGNREHVQYLIMQGYFHDTLTEHGKKIMKGEAA